MISKMRKPLTLSRTFFSIAATAGLVAAATHAGAKTPKEDPAKRGAYLAMVGGCGDCHTILQQGKAGSLEFAKGPDGLAFQHPVDVGGAWAETPCSSCHTGGQL